MRDGRMPENCQEEQWSSHSSNKAVKQLDKGMFSSKKTFRKRQVEIRENLCTMGERGGWRGGRVGVVVVGD